MLPGHDIDCEKRLVLGIIKISKSVEKKKRRFTIIKYLLDFKTQIVEGI